MIWVVWVPSSIQTLDQTRKSWIQQVLSMIAKQGLPESQLYLYVGHSFPKLHLTQPRLADLELNKLKFRDDTSRQGQGASSQASPLIQSNIRAISRWSPDLSGLSELFTTLRIQLGIAQKDHTWESDYQCGHPCSEVTPHVRFIILRDADADDFPMVLPAHMETQFEAFQHPQHVLFRAQVFALDRPLTKQDSINTIAIKDTPIWLRKLTHQPMIGDFNESPRQGGIREFQTELDLLREFTRQQYYVIPAVSLKSYFWNKRYNDISLRVSLNDQSFVRRGVILRPPDENTQAYLQRQQIAKTYHAQLKQARLQDLPQNELSITTRAMIVVLWVIIFVVAVIFTVLILRKNRHLSSDPKITQVSHHTLNSISGSYVNLIPQSSNTSGLYTNKRDLHLANASTAAPSLKKGRPSHASPMIDPDQPSTVPAPAATETNHQSSSDISLPLLINDTPDSPNDQLISDIEENSSSDTNTHLSVTFGSESRLLINHPVKSEYSPQPESELIPSRLVNQREVDPALSHPYPYIPTTSSSSHLDVSPLINDQSRSYPHDIPSPSLLSDEPPLAGLYAEGGPMRRLFFLIAQSPCLVGRDPDTDCPLPPSGERSDRKISREHFELLLLEEGRWEIRCVSSQGLMIAETRLESGDTALIRDQDLMTIGSTQLRFRCSVHWRDYVVSEQLKRISKSTLNS
jgi:hypothetical protein